jgi:hypothetical protein
MQPIQVYNSHLIHILQSRLHESGLVYGDFDLNSWLNGYGSDLLDNLSRRLQINQTLVDA